MNVGAILTVFGKEVRDHLRDRRSLLVALIYPLMGPILLGMMFQFMGGSMQGHNAGPLRVPVVNQHTAPSLTRYLQEHGAALQPVSGDFARRIAGGQEPFVLVLPEQPADAADRPVTVRLIANPSRFDSIVSTGRIIELLHSYQREVVSRRLEAAGVPASLTEVLDIRQENIGRAAGPAVILLTMIAPFLIFTLFTGGVHVTLDSTCGERERGSFEPLMMNPVTRNQVLTGKLGAAVVFTLMALGVQLVAFWVMLHTVPPELLGLSAPPGPLRLATVAAICVPLAMLAVSTQLLISAVTRSMKEAQTYLGLLPLIPGLAGMVLAMAPVAARPVLAAIPTFGQTVLMGQLIRNEFVSFGFVAITAIATLIATAALLGLGFRLYRREELLFPP